MGFKEPGLRGSLRNTGSVIPAFFDVTITNTNSPVQEGDILTVDYSADNTGDAQDMQDIRLEIDSVQEDVDPDVMLSGGASTTGTLEWDTAGEAETTYSATVLSDDDSDSVTVEIESAIPDSVENQYFSTDTAQADPWDDMVGDNDLPAFGSPTIQSDGLNGVDAIVLDGTDDGYDINYSVSEPATIIFALSARDELDGDIGTLWRNEEIASSELLFRDDDNQYRFGWHGESEQAGTPIYDDQIITIAVDESNAVMRLNGSDLITLSASEGDELFSANDSLGYRRNDGDRNLPSDWGGMVVYPNDRLTGGNLDDQEKRVEENFNMNVL